MQWCRFIYTGKINITKYLAQELLVAADQYLLDGLKRLCEYTIAQVNTQNQLFILLLVRVACLCV